MVCTWRSFHWHFSVYYSHWRIILNE
jgi:hypothetical protein